MISGSKLPTIFAVALTAVNNEAQAITHTTLKHLQQLVIVTARFRNYRLCIRAGYAGSDLRFFCDVRSRLRGPLSSSAVAERIACLVLFRRVSSRLTYSWGPQRIDLGGTHLVLPVPPDSHPVPDGKQLSSKSRGVTLMYRLAQRSPVLPTELKSTIHDLLRLQIERVEGRDLSPVSAISLGTISTERKRATDA